MDIKTLDYIFPFVVFTYGLLMTFILNTDFFMHVAKEKLPAELYSQFSAHRGLGFVCLIVGGLWSLQNLWLN